MLTCSVLPAWMTQGSSSPSLTPSLLTPLPLPSVSLCACAVPSNFVFISSWASMSRRWLSPRVGLQGCSGSVTERPVSGGNLEAL